MSVTPTGDLSLPVSRLRSALADVAAFQTWVGAADAAAAAERIFEFAGPDPDEDPDPMALVGLGQSWSGDRERLSGDRPFKHGGELLVYFRQYGYDPATTAWQAARDLTFQALNHIGAIMIGLEALPVLPSRPILLRSRLQEWWRPTPDSEEVYGDLFEFVFTVDYTQGK